MTKPDYTGCVDATCIKVASGKYVDLLNPTAGMIDLRTIASGLSKLCRYSGQCPWYYSVAEHSLHAAELARQDEYDYDVQIAVLLHDATEAYLGDVIRPLKNLLPGYRILEEKMRRAIAERFNIGDHEALVKKYDNIMLKAERYVMWPEDKTDWPGLNEIEDRHVPFEWIAPREIEGRFLMMAGWLGIS